MKICSRRECKKIADIQCSDRQYCYKHYRFGKMKSSAQYNNKYIPLETELENLIPSKLICSACNKKMIWHSKLGKLKDVISLQHNHDGSIMLICQGCNSAHGHSNLGDEYFNIPNNEKYCADCKRILMLDKFGNNSIRKDGLYSICKKCNYNRTKKHRIKNKKRRVTSNYYGISKHIRKHKDKHYITWRAGILIHSKIIFNQYYKTEEQAAIARDEFIIDNKLDVTKYKLNYPMDFYG